MEIFAFTLPVGIGERRQNKKTQMEQIFLEGNESWFHLMEGRECSQIRLLRIVLNTHTHTRTHRVKESNFLKERKLRILKIVLHKGNAINILGRLLTFRLKLF